MIKVYSHPDCPDCISLKANLDYYLIPYEEKDLTNLQILKEFIKIRDTYSSFAPLKGTDSLGIPFIVDGAKATLDWKAYLTKLGFEPMDVNAKSSCSIKGGC